tara:strand:+ start:1208 stop:1528 length:321 start_codon:yes stop_codon:yes gene_type:complete
MLDYYLRFSTEEEAFQAFKEAGYTSQDETGKEFVISATHQVCIDVIGTIYRGGKWDMNEQGEMITIEEPVKLDGYHANVRILSGDIAENLRTFVIDTPNNLYRIFG